MEGAWIDLVLRTVASTMDVSRAASILGVDVADVEQIFSRYRVEVYPFGARVVRGGRVVADVPLPVPDAINLAFMIDRRQVARLVEMLLGRQAARFVVDVGDETVSVAYGEGGAEVGSVVRVCCKTATRMVYVSSGDVTIRDMGVPVTVDGVGSLVVEAVNSVALASRYLGDIAAAAEAVAGLGDTYMIQVDAGWTVIRVDLDGDTKKIVTVTVSPGAARVNVYVELHNIYPVVEETPGGDKLAVVVGNGNTTLSYSGDVPPRELPERVRQAIDLVDSVMERARMLPLPGAVAVLRALETLGLSRFSTILPSWANTTIPRPSSIEAADALIVDGLPLDEYIKAMCSCTAALGESTRARIAALAYYYLASSLDEETVRKITASPWFRAHARYLTVGELLHLSEKAPDAAEHIDPWKLALEPPDNIPEKAKPILARKTAEAILAHGPAPQLAQLYTKLLPPVYTDNIVQVYPVTDHKHLAMIHGKPVILKVKNPASIPILLKIGGRFSISQST